MVLQHPEEARHPLNTARLAVLGLENARLEVGETFSPGLWEGTQSWLLFPGEPDAPALLGPAAGEQGMPLQLIVPDGTWRQARRLVRANPGLATLPRLALPDGLRSAYTVRRACFDTALATIEAIAAALDVLDAPQRHDALLAPFTAMIQGQITAAERARG